MTVIEKKPKKLKLSFEEETELIERIRTYAEQPLLFIETFLDKKLSAKQTKFIKDLENPLQRHHIAIWSRQTGKSTVLSAYIVWCLLFGKGVKVNNELQAETILVLAPILEQVVNLQEKIVMLIEKNEIIDSYIETRNRDRIIAKNGNRIIFLSASPGSHIRGFTATKIFIDESQDVTDNKYYGDIIPFGATTNALLVEAGTPMTKNHFYRAVEAAKEKVTKITVSKQLWYECPFLNAEYVMAQKKNTPEALWRQEFLCEFIEDGVLAFPSKYFEQKQKKWNLADYDFKISLSEYSEAEKLKIAQGLKKGDRYTFGLDLGRAKDFTVLTVVRISEFPLRIEAQIKFELGTNYTDITKMIKSLYEIYQPVEFNFDYTAEKGFADLMQQESIPLIMDDRKVRGAIIFGTKTKMDMVTSAQVLFEGYKFQLPRITTIRTDLDIKKQAQAESLLQQFLNQQFEVGKLDEKVKKYYHPVHENDDQLWSTLLATKNIASNASLMGLAGFHNPWESQALKRKAEDSEILVSNSKMGRPVYSPAQWKREEIIHESE